MGYDKGYDSVASSAAATASSAAASAPATATTADDEYQDISDTELDNSATVAAARKRDHRAYSDADPASDSITGPRIRRLRLETRAATHPAADPFEVNEDDNNRRVDVPDRLPPRFHLALDSPVFSQGLLDIVNIPGDVSTWRPREYYYSLVNFADGKLHRHVGTGSWVLVPLRVGSDDSALRALANGLEGIVFQVAEGCLSTNGRGNVVPRAPGPRTPMIPNAKPLDDLHARATSMCLVVDKSRQKIVATPEGLLMMHKRREDVLYNSYLVKVPSAVSVSQLRDGLTALHRAVLAGPLV